MKLRANSFLGFNFNEWLDDATRNALLCSLYAMTEATNDTVGGDRKDRVEKDLLLAEGCSSVSGMFYMVS